MRLAVITSKTTMKKEKLKYGWKVEKSPLLVIKTHKRVRRRENYGDQICLSWPN